LHNQGEQLTAALGSAMQQTLFRSGEVCIVILDDQSTDGWKESCGGLLDHPRIVVLHGNCGSAARARNALLDYVDDHFSCAEWVARLDADDVLAAEDSLEALISEGRATASQYVIGSNYLRVGQTTLARSNIAYSSVLLNRTRLLAFIQAFCVGDQEQELPSCNLLLRTKSNIRYPDIRSAEDHWLVASLLFFRPETGAVVSSSVYCNYSLSGQTTSENRIKREWTRQRIQLAQAAERWVQVLDRGHTVLGFGLEGIVTLENRQVVKIFYPWSLTRSESTRLAERLDNAPSSIAPRLSWERAGDGDAVCRYDWLEYRELTTFLREEQVEDFLTDCFNAGLVVSNISRDNLRLTHAGRLVNIDIGSDIVPFSVSRFVDSAARLYAICILGYRDQELVRRKSTVPQRLSLQGLPGFERFYGYLVSKLHDLNEPMDELGLAYVDSDTTLLIKACAQDADTLHSQVVHIVNQLCYPAKFDRICLAVDMYAGPFLREYSLGNLEKVLAVAERLKTEKVIDTVLIAPSSIKSICGVYARWFADDSVIETHTNAQAPLYPQLWAFEQVETRFVLQCDSDVLIGRHDYTHDYLVDMKSACSDPGVLSVGFNIPQSKPGFKLYTAPIGGHVPEVRFCLLDLEAVFDQLPINNSCSAGRFELMWHRALEQHQRQKNLASLRGGDSRSFYIHPQNEDKLCIDLPTLRDIVGQGLIPVGQQDHFDLVPNAGWQYPSRSESVIFLLKGKDTPGEKLQRCLGSLRKQTSQSFGIILIEDGGRAALQALIPLLLGDLLAKTTLIRREQRRGYIPNFIEAIECICNNPSSLIVILDQDDALMSPNLVERLLDEVAGGADLINGTMFRPCKPSQLYTPTYENARQNGGGNVWAHMRAFRKSLFDRVPISYFCSGNGAWFEMVTDYATMLPMSELAEQPVHIDDIYCYYHEREAYSDLRRDQAFTVLKEIFEMPSLQGTAHACLSGRSTSPESVGTK
tara:strand:+ start:2599 stop:5535 length:2937 start_codon:yes stop_codon:yes gene_type:complete